jgi:teichuronic acid biosynthesis glycosyltransferase TuaG
LVLKEISIIIPYYNAAWCISEALQSVLMQTVAPKEVIFVNDGSTDHGKEIVDRYASQFTKTAFIHLHQENLGLGAARNFGLSKVTASHVAWLDADDVFLPEKIARCSEIINTQPTPWLVHQATEWDGKRTSIKRWLKQMKSVESLLLDGNPYLPSCTVLETQVARGFPLHTDKEMHGTEDLDLWIRLYRKGILPFCLNESLSWYRIHNEAMSQDLETHLIRTRKCWEHNDIPVEVQKKALERKYYEMARVMHRRGEHDKAAHFYRLGKGPVLKSIVAQMLNRAARLLG